MSQMNHGVVALDAVVYYTDTTAKSVFVLPKNARPLYFLVQTNTVFNDSGTDYLDIGTRADADYFANNVDVSSTGSQMIVSLQTAELEYQTEIIATYAGGSGDATAGEAEIVLVYSNPFVSH